MMTFVLQHTLVIKEGGVGKFMINEIMKINPNAFAKVKLENEASVKLLNLAGLRKCITYWRKNEA